MAKKLPAPAASPLQNPQAEPNVTRARNINDIFPISKEHYSFESYASERGVVELSKAEIGKANQYTKSIKNSPNHFTKKVILVRDLIIGGLDGFQPETLKKYISEGKVEVLEKYLDVIEQYFKITADILVELGRKKELYAEDLVEIKRRRIKEILSENAQSQNVPETQGIAENKTQDEAHTNTGNSPSNNNVGQIPHPQTDLYEPQASAYDNTSMYYAFGSAGIGLLAVGVILCAVGMPKFGGIFIAGAVVCALIVGIVAYESASRKKQENLDMSTRADVETAFNNTRASCYQETPER